ncbi:MAG: methylase, partial [Selenomonadaceae bacterium]|nr:methylase [Selenomonadaceae bacterium]
MNKIKNFVNQWRGRGYERGEAQIFWLSFLRDVFGVSEPEKFIKFEVPVKLKHKSFIDGFFPDTKVIIEQKSLSESLSQGKSQSDGTILTPYEQAQRYGSSLPYSMRPRWIIVCNFAEFLIYDMETLSEPKKIFLNELPEKF